MSSSRPDRQAHRLFGDRVPQIDHYVALLADTGVSHGLIGPREVPRLWERHIINCVLVADLIEKDQEVIDVGSGAGLPGLVLAIARPDLRLHLVESMQRRTSWLQAAAEELNMENVTVHRARAEQMAGVLRARYVTARAVAPLSTLAGWTLPLLTPAGWLLAIKGESVEHELTAARPVLEQANVRHAEVIHLGDDNLGSQATVVRIQAGSRTRTAPPRRRSGSGTTRSRAGQTPRRRGKPTIR